MIEALTLQLLADAPTTPEEVRDIAREGLLDVSKRPVQVVIQLEQWVATERRWLVLTGGYGSGKTTGLHYFFARRRARAVIDRVREQQVGVENWNSTERVALIAAGPPVRRDPGDFPEFLELYGPEERQKRANDQYDRDVAMWERLQRAPEPFDFEAALQKELERRPYRPLIYTAEDVLQMAWDDRHWLDALNGALTSGDGVVGVDDFGREHWRKNGDEPTSWGREQWEGLFDLLYVRKHGLVMSTNKKAGEIKERYGGMIYDRIRGRGRMVETGEVSLRTPPELPQGFK